MAPLVPLPVFPRRADLLKPELESGIPAMRTAPIYGTRRVALPASQTPPVYSFLQKTRDIDPEPRQYALTAFCSQKKDSSKKVVGRHSRVPDEEVAFIGVPLDLKVPKQTLIPHPLPKKQTQHCAAIVTYEPLTTFTPFPKLPFELRTKICKQTPLHCINQGGNASRSSTQGNMPPT
ncbi:hypothetical protein DL98DRAFT_199099 [Cadophora sp. DSE1049]|nr:hypothetical protein DL98DRAFT_199099 [Cadophora sp. DSE1049]